MAVLPGSVLLGAVFTFVHVRLRHHYLLFERALLGLQYVREPSVESIDDALARGAPQATNAKKAKKTKKTSPPVLFQIPTFAINRTFFTRTRPFYVEFDNCCVLLVAFVTAYLIERAVVCFSGPNLLFRGSEWLLVVLLGISCFEALHILQTLQSGPSDYYLAWVVAALGVMLSSIVLLAAGSTTESPMLDFHFPTAFSRLEANMLSEFRKFSPELQSVPSFRAPFIVVLSLLCGTLSACLAFPCLRFTRLLFQALMGDIPHARHTTALLLLDLLAPCFLSALWFSQSAAALVDGFNLAGFALTEAQFASHRIHLSLGYAVFRMLLLRLRAQDYLNTGAIPMSEVATLGSKSKVASQITQHRIFAVHMHVFTACLMYMVPALSFVALGLLARQFDPNTPGFCVDPDSAKAPEGSYASQYKDVMSLSPGALGPELLFTASSFLLWWGMSFMAFFSLVCLLAERISFAGSPSAVFQSAAQFHGGRQRQRQQQQPATTAVQQS